MRLKPPPWIELGVLLVLSTFVLAGAALVPFHPDETSWLFQSRDLERIFSAPQSLAWRPGEATPEMTYRLLNAPLAKYALGAARLFAGFPAGSVATDWSWSKSWEENVADGALPARALLDAARRGSALLLLPAMVALYLCGRAVGGRATGITAAIFLATNALVLLHGRRAMAEGALTLAVCLALLGLIYADRHPWWAGAAAGLAFAAKTSAAVWFPLGWIAVAWTADPARRSLRATLARLGTYTLAAVLVTFLLYPVLWAHPLEALVQMWRARQALVAAQVATTAQAMPWAVLTTPWARAATLLAHLFFAPPQFAEAANYLTQTAGAEAAYLASPGTALFRGLAGGALMLGLTLLGMVLGVRRDTKGPQDRRAGALALVATLVQGAALLLAVPLAFQRYVLPLVPLVCLWAGHGLAGLVMALTRTRRPDPGPAAAGE